MAGEISGSTRDHDERHLVLVHGTCHGGWCWYKVANLLREAGHKVTAVDLAASGINPKQIDEVLSIDDYHEPLFELLEGLPPEERVILVGHSYGGLALASAMERYPHKIALAVFVTAFMISPTFSFADLSNILVVGEDFFMDSEYTSNPVNPAGLPSTIIFGPKLLSTTLYQNSPPQDLTLATMLVRWSQYFGHNKSEEQLVVTEKNYGSVKRAFFVCCDDRALTEETQRMFIEKTPPHEIREIVGADHMAMFSKPQELTANLLELAAKFH